MKKFFDDFEGKIQILEEKIDILSKWHIAKGHHGGSEISEDCWLSIKELSDEFQKLSAAYQAAEGGHENFVKSNIDYLFGSLKRYDEEIGRLLDKNPEYILFDVLEKVSREVLGVNRYTPNGEGVERYLLALVRKDMKERGIL